MELHHLERNIPGIKSGSKYLNFGNTGITTINNLSNKDSIYLFNKPEFWS